MFLRVKLVGSMGIQRGITEPLFLNVKSGLVVHQRKPGMVEIFNLGDNQATLLGEFKAYSDEEVAAIVGGGALPEAKEEKKKNKNVKKGAQDE